MARRGDRPQRLSGVVRVVDVFAEGPGKGVVILPAACAHDHAGHKGRARRGIEKEGGYYPTKCRKTTHTTAKEKSTAQKKQVDETAVGEAGWRWRIPLWSGGYTYNEWRGKARTGEMQDGRPGNLGS